VTVTVTLNVHPSVCTFRRELGWDDGNRTKVHKHGLTLSEIEHAMRTALRRRPSGFHRLLFPWRAHPPVQRPLHARRKITRYEAAFGSEDDH
jgi:hypothetical protein